MKTCLAIVALLLVCGCGDKATDVPAEVQRDLQTTPPRAKMLPDAVAFFREWLESHGHTDVVEDERGVGVAGSATRLWASLYASNPHDSGGYVVETEFRILLPSGQEIIEFVAGLGETEEQAIHDTYLNFTLTTFHVVYKAFINKDDPHVTAKPLEINGHQRDVIFGDILSRGAVDDDQLDLNTMRTAISGAVAKTTLSSDAHWLKIVYGQIDNKPVTVDNEEHASLTAAIRELNWPSRSGFYMAKQFIVIK